MRDDPAGADLLETARTVLREELIDLLPVEQRLAALMVANAMAISARQLRAGDDPERLELSSLAVLLGVTIDAQTRTAVREALILLNQSLCQEIRSGGADYGSAKHSAVYAHLRKVIQQKVMESNPRYLNTVS